MSPHDPVEVADRLSRRRAFGVAAAAFAFLAAALVVRGPDRVHVAGLDLWALNAVLLLVLFATGGGLIYSGRVRSLLNDVVSRANYQTAAVTGFWVAMVASVALYALAGIRPLSARDAVYGLVTSSLSAALFVFAYLEYRANRDD